MNKILVTGAAGYIGSVLVRQLLEAGHAVRALDDLRYGGEALLGVLHHPRFEFVRGDITDRAAVSAAMSGIEAVVHLAAIVGDPACAKQPDLARAVNGEGSRIVHEAAAAAGAERFLFASTCSNYGRMADRSRYVDEDSELRPVSLYAELKVAFERELLDDGGTARRPRPTVLRFATAYGLSPRMRFDLTVNEFTRDLVSGRTLKVFGEQFYRPYCHLEDLARAVGLVLAAPLETVGWRVFNVGDTRENYTKKDVVEHVLKVQRDGRVEYVRRDEDPRDYRVDFTRIARETGFAITRRLHDGVREIAHALRSGIFTDPFSSKYGNT